MKKEIKVYMSYKDMNLAWDMTEEALNQAANRWARAVVNGLEADYIAQLSDEYKTLMSLFDSLLKSTDQN